MKHVHTALLVLYHLNLTLNLRIDIKYVHVDMQSNATLTFKAEGTSFKCSCFSLSGHHLHYYAHIDPKHLDFECTWVCCCPLLCGVKTTGGGLVSKGGNHSPPSNIVAVISAFICLRVSRSFEMADLPFLVNACRGSVWLPHGRLKKCDLTDER